MCIHHTAPVFCSPASFCSSPTLFWPAALDHLNDDRMLDAALLYKQPRPGRQEVCLHAARVFGWCRLGKGKLSPKFLLVNVRKCEVVIVLGVCLCERVSLLLQQVGRLNKQSPWSCHLSHPDLGSKHHISKNPSNHTQSGDILEVFQAAVYFYQLNSSKETNAAIAGSSHESHIAALRQGNVSMINLATVLWHERLICAVCYSSLCAFWCITKKKRIWISDRKRQSCHSDH